MAEQRERRLIAEWAIERHPKDRVIFNCPLGSIREELVVNMGLPKAIRVSRPWRLEADAVVITKEALILAEAKIFRPRDAVGDLLVYKPMVAVTPELLEYKDLALELVMVIPWVNESVKEMAAAASIKIELYSPPWVATFIEEHNKYWTADYRRARDDRNALRKVLGV